MAHKILIVEDESYIVDILDFNLKKEGFETDAAYNGTDGLKKALSGGFDLILLDVMLPGLDGFEVCRRLREKSTTPVIMLTAREEESDKVTGLEIGADDYITKPFSIKELIARVKANLRRQSLTDRAALQSQTVFGDLIIDRDNFEVKKRGETVNLTLREFELLKFLSAQPKKVYSREELLKEVWGYEYAVSADDGRTVDVMIRRLREKIEDNDKQPRYIVTKRGAGYYFDF
ncbi:MAG: response regulator transcription factor [Clostridia bacterium]|nr:response regulator transcription factor [Clostridia bacterium]